MRSRISTIGPWLAGFAAALVPSSAAFAQGCAMCYNDAAANNPAGIKALQHGILILGIPVLTLFIGIFVMAYLNRDKFNEVGAESEDFDRELNEWLEQPPMEAAAKSQERDEEPSLRA